MLGFVPGDGVGLFTDTSDRSGVLNDPPSPGSGAATGGEEKAHERGFLRWLVILRAGWLLIQPPFRQENLGKGAREFELFLAGLRDRE